MVIVLLNIFLFITNDSTLFYFFLFSSFLGLIPMVYLSNFLLIDLDQGSELYKYDVLIINFFAIGILQLFFQNILLAKPIYISGVKLEKESIELFGMNVTILIVIGIILILFTNNRRKKVTSKITDIVLENSYKNGFIKITPKNVLIWELDTESTQNILKEFYNRKKILSFMFIIFFIGYIVIYLYNLDKDLKLLQSIIVIVILFTGMFLTIEKFVIVKIKENTDLFKDFKEQINIYSAGIELPMTSLVYLHNLRPEEYLSKSTINLHYQNIHDIIIEKEKIKIIAFIQERKVIFLLSKVLSHHMVSFKIKQGHNYLHDIFIKIKEEISNYKVLEREGHLNTN